MPMSVRDAKIRCLLSECSDSCPIRDLCKMTASIGPTLEMWYENMQYPDNKPVKEVILENIQEHEKFLEGLRKLNY